MTTVTSLEFCLPLFLPKVFLFFEIQLVRQVLCKWKVWECRDSNMFHECHMIRLACKLTWLSRVSMQSCLQLKDWVALHWRDFYLYQQFSETGKKKHPTRSYSEAALWEKASRHESVCRWMSVATSSQQHGSERYMPKRTAGSMRKDMCQGHFTTVFKALVHTPCASHGTI